MNSKIFKLRITPKSPIWITNDNDLNDSFPGKGTFDDPIRIEGFNITSSSSPLIYIQDTTFYFEIANNYLNGQSSSMRGIYFYDMVHGTIRNTTITSCYWGIDFQHSSENTIFNNTIFQTSYSGNRHKISHTL